MVEPTILGVGMDSAVERSVERTERSTVPAAAAQVWTRRARMAGGLGGRTDARGRRRRGTSGPNAAGIAPASEATLPKS